MVLPLFCYGLGMVLLSLRHGFAMVLAWFCYGFVMGLGMVLASLRHSFAMA